MIATRPDSTFGTGQKTVGDTVPARVAAAYQATFTDGATAAFLVGSLMMLGASLVIWIFLNVKHEELATDGPEAAVHVG